ncbi:MAG: 4-hydroxy-3-methylbut-2-enyl diphosphate reductase [Chthoniobacterales bacterium]
MKILLAEHFGMCFGVRDAIAQAEKLAAARPLTILGELVHNPLVRERLRGLGVREGSLDDATNVASPDVMITAHGASDARRNEWNNAGHTVADGTCPLVRHAHSQLRRLVAFGCFPVVIGQPGHVEVRGLTEDFPGAVVIGGSADIAQLPLAARYGVVSQTTQPIDRVLRLVAEIRQAHPKSEVRFADTVCKPTKDRQLALQRLIAKADVIVVVGGRASNNTRQLVETCRVAGKRAIHIESAEELVGSDFSSAATVGLTAGTSTLPETVREVEMRLLDFAASRFRQSA